MKKLLYIAIIFLTVGCAPETSYYIKTSVSPDSNIKIAVINEKLQLMLSEAKQAFKEEDVAKKLISILDRYESLKQKEGDAMMDELFEVCESLQKEPWFDKLSASVIVQFLAEIAESDHKIEKTEIQMLQNLADIFGVDPPRI